MLNCNKIVLSDGATATFLEKKLQPFNISINQKEFFLVNLTHPEIVEEVYTEYYHVGSQIHKINTFNLPNLDEKLYSDNFPDFQDLLYKLSEKGAQIAKNITIKNKNPPIIAGSIGPFSFPLSKIPDSTHKRETIIKLQEKMSSIIYGLISGGIDAFLIESIYDFQNTKLLLEIIFQIQKEKKLNLPIYFSATINENGTIFSGETLLQLYNKLFDLYPNISGFGVNCCSGIQHLDKNYSIIFQELVKIIKCPLILCPSAGLPDKTGNYSEDPQIFSTCMKHLVEKLLYFNPKLKFIIGGCCGTTPEHIKILKLVFS